MVPPVDFEPWPSLGLQVAAWIEKNLVHGPGDLKGDDIHLDDEKRAILVRMYEVYPRGHRDSTGNLDEGRRRFKRCALSVRKGWAKTEFAAMIAAAELHPNAPVRCIGWDKDGELIGGGVRDPYIPMVAYTEEQSDELAYSALKVMLEEGPLAGDFESGKLQITGRNGDGKAVSLAGSPNARDGARTTFQICDETHRWEEHRLIEAHDTMLANIPKRKAADAWTLEITTSFAPGANSIAERTMDYARAVADGKIPADESRLFFFHRQADQKPVEEGGYDIENTADIRAAALEASGPAVAQWSDIESIVAQFQDPNADKPYLCRIWLNWIVQPSDRAFNMAQWAKLAKPHVVPDGEKIVLGFDGSRRWDSTGLIATHIKTGYQWTVRIWERPLDAKTWEVPEIEVDEAVHTCFSRWDVVRFYCDPPYWETHVAAWAGKYGAERVIEWWTNRRNAMAYAIRSYCNAIADNELSHDGNAVLTSHLGNSCRLEITIKTEEGKDEQLFLIFKERKDSPHKIDGAVSAVISWEARNDAIAAGALNEDMITSSFEVW